MHDAQLRRPLLAVVALVAVAVTLVTVATTRRRARVQAAAPA